MAFFIGTDEAGYGPNLGPLVISATVWNVPDKSVDRDFYSLLADSVSRGQGNRSKIPIADSKVLYKPGTGLAGLERGLFSMLSVMDMCPRTWHEMWHRLAESSIESMFRIPWYSEYEAALPYDVNLDDLTDSVAAFNAVLRRTAIVCRAIRSVAIFPEEFNAALDRYGGKGELLSLTTLALVRDCLNGCDEFPVLVNCDKHGGRNRYAGLLQHVFPNDIVEVVHESRAESVYRWGSDSRRVEIRFVARGESFLPSALASMASKYLRELAMKAFNHFWQKRMPGVRPTAGYPVDARRFRSEIEPMRRQLQIDLRTLWRNR